MLLVVDDQLYHQQRDEQANPIEDNCQTVWDGLLHHWVTDGGIIDKRLTCNWVVLEGEVGDSCKTCEATVPRLCRLTECCSHDAGTFHAKPGAKSVKLPDAA
eukprot:GHRR01025831.1.p2 GENE.GHRR01025831.1~~GHRR01025831.1.p2  ORF type:complete len:102 (-),score=22.46 GHRR01025831.1:590-895(-)